MIKIVCDTNVLVSGVIKKRGETVLIFELFREQKIELIISEPLLDELVDVLHYPHIKDKYHITDKAIKKIENILKRQATVVAGNYEVGALDNIDPKDNKVLACALEGKAEYIVSGDKKHILPLKQFHGIQIITVAGFLDVVEKNNPPL